MDEVEAMKDLVNTTAPSCDGRLCKITDFPAHQCQGKHLELADVKNQSPLEWVQRDTAWCNY